MVLTIKNFSNPVGPGVTETAPTNLSATAGVLKATITWTSATGESGVVWTEEKLVRKEGSAPAGSMDGTVVTTITTKDTYASTGYEDTGLDSTKTYYYKAFAIYDNGTERGSSAVNVTPTAPTFTGLYFTAQEAGSQVQLNKNGNPTSVNLETSTDGTTWTDYTIGNSITLANVGDKVYMRNKSETDTGFSTGTANYYQFSMTGNIGASGDVSSLMNKNGTTTSSAYCYFRMFYGCTSLTTAPELPATTLADGCYRNMFYGCTSLTTSPELPATTLATSCYASMFYNCTSLTTAPELPVTTLAERCYRCMFENCTSLTTAPELPATTLAEYCYHKMFENCTSLTTVPALPATTLADACYRNMFYGCSNIKLSTTQTGEYQTAYRIPTTGTGTTATGRNVNMFYNTGGTFTGAPSINTTYYTSNTVI